MQENIIPVVREIKTVSPQAETINPEVAALNAGLTAITSRAIILINQVHKDPIAKIMIRDMIKQGIW